MRFNPEPAYGNSEDSPQMPRGVVHGALSGMQPAPAAPAQVDVYGNGDRLSDGTLKSNNPALTAALGDAYGNWQGGKLSESDALNQAFTKAGIDPKMIPQRADLDAYHNILQYNGVGADPMKALQETVRYDDGRSTNEANTRDRIAQGLANGQTHDQIWKNIQGYNDQHQGGWSKENLGIDGKTLALLAASALIPGALSLAGPELAGGGLAGLDVAGSMGLEGAMATGVNAGLIGTGTSLAQGHNIGDSLKTGAMAGVTGGALSAASPYISDAVGSLDTGSTIANNALTQAGTGTVNGLLHGQNIGTALTNGARGAATSGISAIANPYIQDDVNSAVGATGLDGSAAQMLTQAGNTIGAGTTNGVLRGQNIGTALTNGARGAVTGAVNPYIQSGVNSAVGATGLDGTAAQMLTQVGNSAGSGALSAAFNGKDIGTGALNGATGSLRNGANRYVNKVGDKVSSDAMNYLSNLSTPVGGLTQSISGG